MGVYSFSGLAANLLVRGKWGEGMELTFATPSKKARVWRYRKGKEIMHRWNRHLTVE